MPRARMIRPEFWSDEKVGSLTYLERLLFIGMWNFADDEGLIKASPLYLKANIFPYDNIKPEEIDRALSKMSKSMMIFPYTKNNQKYAWIIKFRIYQRIDKPQKPTNPIPSIQNGLYKRAVAYRDGYICHICGEETDLMADSKGCKSKFPSVDHLIPQSKGGGHQPSNLACACISCNKSRCNNDLENTEIALEPIQECSENVPGIFQSEENIREENIKKETPPTPPRGRCVGLDEDFDKFWKAYPRKIAKPDALKAWKKSNGKPNIEKILAVLEKQKSSEDWTKDGGRFIPHPTTYINKGRWFDEVNESESFISLCSHGLNPRECKICRDYLPKSNASPKLS